MPLADETKYTKLPTVNLCQINKTKFFSVMLEIKADKLRPRTSDML